MKKSDLYLYIIFLTSTTIVVLNRYTNFHINDYRFHFLIDFVAASSFAIIIGHLLKKLHTYRAISFTIVIVGLLLYLKAYFTWGGDWKTQTLIFRNIEDKNKTINLQLRGDRFAFGYKKRIVEIYKLIPYMEWTTNIDTLKIDRSKWEKLNIELNEMQF